MKRNTLCGLTLVALFGLSIALVQAKVAAFRVRAPGGAPGAAGNVSLPYQIADNTNQQWAIYDGGWFRQNGNPQVFSQGAMLNINNNTPSSNSVGALDPKTGELVLENMNGQNCTVTRRILLDKDAGSIRYVDIFKNTSNQEQTVVVNLTTNTNYGVNQAQIITDPKRKDNQIGWVAMTGCNRAAVDMFAGKGSKVAPQMQYQPGNNMVSAVFSLVIPAGKSQAIMHLHTTAATIDAGTQFINGMKESKVMQTIPADVRRLIVNYASGMSYIGDYEVLRGDAFDVVELRSGDQMRGTLKDENYKLTTFYGSITLPKEQVVGVLNVGQFRPRQLIVTTDGQIFGGKLDRDTATLELSSGQVTQVPLSQITRMGYRKRTGEPEEWVFDKPFVLMRTGDRVNLEMPTQPIEVTTRYGVLKLAPDTVSSIAFQSEENGVHTIYLTDGSKFAGLVNASQFEMKLAGGTQSVTFPASSVVRLTLNGKVADSDDTTASLTLVNDDLLVGSLTGALKLDTAFDTLSLQASEIRKLTHTAPGSQDMQVTLWDSSTVSGQMQEQEVQCKLASGATVQVPLALVGEYNQPLPHPSAAVVEKIKGLVAELVADDWKVRDHAESSLVAIGPGVISVLKDLRDSQPPEAQQRIDSVLKQLEKQGAAVPHNAGPGGAAPPMPMPMINQPVDRRSD